MLASRLKRPSLVVYEREQEAVDFVLNHSKLALDKEIVDGVESLKNGELKTCMKCTKEQILDLVNQYSQDISCSGCVRTLKASLGFSIPTKGLMSALFQEKEGTVYLRPQFVGMTPQELGRMFTAFNNRSYFSRKGNVKRQRCSLHTAHPRVEEDWLMIWEEMPMHLKEKVACLDVDDLSESLTEHLKNLYFCRDCRGNVLRALDLLVGFIEPEDLPIEDEYYEEYFHPFHLTTEMFDDDDDDDDDDVFISDDNALDEEEGVLEGGDHGPTRRRRKRVTGGSAGARARKLDLEYLPVEEDQGDHQQQRILESEAGWGKLEDVDDNDTPINLSEYYDGINMTQDTTSSRKPRRKSGGLSSHNIHGHGHSHELENAHNHHHHHHHHGHSHQQHSGNGNKEYVSDTSESEECDCCCDHSSRDCYSDYDEDFCPATHVSCALYHVPILVRKAQEADERDEMSRANGQSSDRHAPTLKDGQNELLHCIGKLLLSRIKEFWILQLVRAQTDELLVWLTLSCMRTNIQNTFQNGKGNEALLMLLEEEDRKREAASQKKAKKKAKKKQKKVKKQAQKEQEKQRQQDGPDQEHQEKEQVPSKTDHGWSEDSEARLLAQLNMEPDVNGAADLAISPSLHKHEGFDLSLDDDLSDDGEEGALTEEEIREAEKKLKEMMSKSTSRAQLRANLRQKFNNLCLKTEQAM